jgi:tetratricopeptide (TPR) repeat protein
MLSAGKALLALGRSGEASESSERAVQILEGLGELKRLAEARAGLARAWLAAGKREQALDLVERVLADLTGQSKADSQGLQELAFSTLEGMDQPFEALLSCYKVLDSAGDPRAEPLLVSAYRLLFEQASWIEDEGLRKSFLENIAAHKEIIDLWGERASDR